MDNFALDAPPPRYAYESDSSEDAFDDPEAGDAPPSARPPRRPKRPRPRVELRWHGERPATGGKVFVCVGEAGEAWCRGVKLAAKESGRLDVDDSQVASVVRLEQATLVLAAPAVALDAQTPAALALLKALRPSSLHIVDSYSLQNFLGPPDELDVPPLRFLQTTSIIKSESEHLKLYDVPNLVTGLSAALVVQAATLAIPTLLLLCPSLASSSSVHSATEQPRLRPSGIYDPSETGHDVDADNDSLHLFAMLTPSERKALGWSELAWDPKAIKSQGDAAWSWLRAQERSRERRRGDYDELYM